MKIIDIKAIGSSTVFSWTKDYLFKVLTTGKNPPLTTPIIMAAFNQLDRRDFLPADLKSRAYEDIDTPIGHGESFTRPTTLATIAELIQPKPGGTYLDIGTGTGYFALLLGFIAGQNGKVFTVERVQWLWELARSSSTKYRDITNVVFLYRDGSVGLPEQAPFDGIHVSFALPAIPETLKVQLNPNGGRLVAPTTNMDLRLVERNGAEYTEEIIPGHVFKEGKVGKA